MLKVSIVIPVKEVNDYIRESVPRILELDYKDYEILIFPDAKGNEEFEKTRIIPTGHVGPAEKRDLAVKYAEGEILAFLDDDAYPEKDWLEKAVRHFENPDVVAVGGPAVTPPHDSFWQKVSGAVFLSRLSGGSPERYWPAGKIKEVDDWPSVNLLVRKSDFEAVGGFDSAYWPGEDTKLCLDLVEKIGKKIIYDPDVRVYHHRRPGLKRHLRQVGSYGLHRGFFAKKYPRTSLKLNYFLPSFFFGFVLFGWICLFLPYPAKLAYPLAWIVYSAALLFSFCDIISKERNVMVALATLPYIFLTHVWYGFRFLKGLATKDLKSKLRK